jgi:Flp pilus assembly secretin CpaC
MFMRTSGPRFYPRLRRVLTGAIAAATIAASSIATPAAAETPQSATMITVDQAMILRLSAPAGAIVVGNPGIADATVMDATTLVITGRSYGTTNLIVLDENGVLLTQELITVLPATDQVTVYRRSTRETLSCNPICAPTLNVGDADGTFGTTTQQIQARAAIATGG